MKIIKILSLFFIITMSLISCGKENLKQNLQSPVYGTDFTLEAVNDDTANKDAEVALLISNIHRELKECTGGMGMCAFEVCDSKVCQAKVGQVIILVRPMSGDPIFSLALAQPLDGKFDTNFYVDRDLKDGEFIIPKGVYSLDKSIGKFGGYNIIIKQLL